MQCSDGLLRCYSKQALCLQITLVGQSETRTAEEAADKHCYWLISTVETLSLADIQCLLHTFKLEHTHTQTDRHEDLQAL